MRGRVLTCIIIVLALFGMAGCQSASKKANAIADQQMYKPVAYSAAQGPVVVVIPGEIKSANATYTQKVAANNIADYGEIELTKANFQVLERSDLGPMLQEIEIAANLGDAEQLKKFKKGKFKATNWLVRFDILKAEPVAEVKQSFDGAWLGAIAGSAVGSATNSWAAGVGTGAAVGSIHAEEASGVWIIGMRYKILDANTGEQKATGYIEDKMEMGSSGGGALGVSQTTTHQVTLDTMTQRLVQQAVMELDKMK
jgi:curli biogenesis system outer membrane secretion channel CsgG